MKQLALTGLAAVALLGSLAMNRAAAQYNQFYGPAYRPGGAYGSYGRAGPALSPYLNLTRGGNPAANYFLGVLPEIDRRATQAEVGTMINQLDRRLESPPAQQPQAPEDVVGSLTGGGLPPTGHAASFTSYGTYYGLGPPTPPNRAASTQVRGR